MPHLRRRRPLRFRRLLLAPLDNRFSGRHRTAVALTIAVGLTVAACGGGGGGSSSTPTPPASPDLTVHAEEIKFDKKAYTVHGGEVKIAYPNDGTQTHTLIVQSPQGDKVGEKLRIAPGKATGGVYTLTPGEYTLYCDITGHREAGMVASLTVTG